MLFYAIWSKSGLYSYFNQIDCERYIVCSLRIIFFFGLYIALSSLKHLGRQSKILLMKISEGLNPENHLLGKSLKYFTWKYDSRVKQQKGFQKKGPLVAFCVNLILQSGKSCLWKKLQKGFQWCRKWWG